MRFPHACLLALTAALLTACGGGGGSSGAPSGPTILPPTVIEVVQSTAAADGYIAQLTGNPPQVVTNLGLVAGDGDASNQAAMPASGFLTFDVSNIPANATIVSATLRVYQLKGIGNPTGLGNLRTIHIDYGPTLDAGDITPLIVSQASQVLSAVDATGWREVDVKAEVELDFQRGSRRVQFGVYTDAATTNDNNQDDFYAMEDGDDTNQTGNLPELVVVYRLP